MLGRMYRGALFALQDHKNDEQLVLAAHEFRELMEKLPVYFDIPVDNLPQLQHELRGLADKWTSTKRSAARGVDGAWSGDMDQHILTWLSTCEAFFTARDNRPSAGRAKTTIIVQHLDMSGARVSKKTMSERVERWHSLRQYFQDVSHHQEETTSADMQENAQSLEQFLLECFPVTTYADFEEIDQLITEGEKDA